MRNVGLTLYRSMLRLVQIVRRLFVDEDGPTSIEYGVMTALIAAAVIFGATTMGNETKDIFENLADKLDDILGKLFP